MVALLFVSLYVIAALISSAQMLMSSFYVGELSVFEYSVDKIDIFLITILNCSSFLFALGAYFLLKNKKILMSRRLRLEFNLSRLNKFIFITLVLHIGFLLSTGVGRLLSDATHSLSPIFSFSKPDAFIPIYYLLLRGKKKYQSLFFINICLFFALKILQGWTGFILIIFFLELSYRYNKYGKFKFRTIIYYLLLIFVVGGAAYKYLYVLKNDIRGTKVDEITYFEGVMHLASRLTMNPISVAGFEKADSIEEIFHNDDVKFKEIVALFRPVSPSFLMENKEFRSLNNNILQAFYSDLTMKTSSDIGIVIYAYLLFKSDLSQFLAYIIVLLFLLFLVKIFYDSIEQYKGQLSFLYLLLLLKVSYTASLEVVFGYGVIGAFYVFLLLTIFRCYKIKKTVRCPI